MSKEPRGPRPPRWAAWLLRRSLPADDREAVVTELEDLWVHRRRKHGPGAAARWYVRSVLGFGTRLLWRRFTGYDARKRGGGGMQGMGTEIRAAARRLARAPVFTGIAVTTLAVGVGAFASVFSLVDGVLLEEPAYQDPEELRYVWRDYWFGLERGWLGGPDIVGLAAHDDAFEGAVALRTGQVNLTAPDGTGPASATVMYASADFFRMLGVRPSLGRGFLPGEDGSDAAAVTVLGHALWQSRYGGDPSVLGRSIRVDGSPVEVVGVAAPDFRFMMHSSLGQPVGADLWMPLPFDLAAEDPGSGMFAGLVRVADGASPDRVRAAVDAVAQDLDDLFDNPGLKMWSVGLVDDLVGPVRPALAALLAAAALLLLVLASNLATLFLGRAALRDREIAVRAALGAGRGRLVRGVAAEAVLVGGGGIVLGLLLARGLLPAVRAVAPSDLPRLWAVEIDGSVALVAGLAGVASVLLATLAPALGAARHTRGVQLRDGGARGTAGTGSPRLRSGLVVVQVALGLVLLVGAGLVGRAFLDLLRADPGFDGGPALTFLVPLDPVTYPDDPAAADFERRFRRALDGLPGVTSVGAADALPLGSSANQRGVTFPGAPGNTGDPEADNYLADYLRVGPGYAEAVGLRTLAGRTFRDGDGGADARVAIIDDVMAERFYPGADPVGGQVQVLGDTLRIVGVVDQARIYTVHSDDRGQVYVPLEFDATSGLSFVVATTGEPEGLVPQVRERLATVDGGLPLSDVRPLRDYRNASLERERLGLALLAVFALSAGFLAVLGVYGVVANSVTRRTHEMGVRMALGAAGRDVVRMVVAQGAGLALAGLVLGGLGTALLTPVLGSVVVGVEARDPWVYAAVGSSLWVVALLASLLPARRATRIDPVRALRGDAAG